MSTARSRRPPLAREAGAPLYRKLARALLGDIAKGRLRPGDQLPTEDELIAAYRVSRITVRQALDILRARGLLERIAGRGSFVTRPPGAYIMTINSIEDVVLAGADSEVSVLEWKAIRPGPAVERRLQLSNQRVWMLRTVRHRDAAPLCYSETYTLLDIGRPIDPADLRRHTVLETIETKLGLQIGVAVEEISAGLANRELGTHLQIPRGAPLVIVEMTLFDVSDRPIEYFKTAYRADRFTRRTELRRVRHDDC
jgi:GntR family transcriptional regulator